MPKEIIRSSVALFLACLTVCILITAVDYMRSANDDTASVVLMTTHDKLDAVLTEATKHPWQGVTTVTSTEPHDRIDDTVYMTLLISVILTIVTSIIFGLFKLYRRWLSF